MNREKKEQLKREQERLNGLSGDALAQEIECIKQEKIDEREAYWKRVEEFPEEFDWMYDSPSELRDRKRGKSPMNREYQDKVNQRRIEQGLEPFFSEEELNPPTPKPEYIEPSENDSQISAPEGFSELEVAMYRLIGGYLRLNRTDYQQELIHDYQQNHPSVNLSDIEDAYAKANDLWIEAYCD
ncbi:MAG: hypothetical protein GYB18_02045 [Oceanospirillales bacterium]|nr:hypothetical protein [Oceanospirillales bacterium]